MNSRRTHHANLEKCLLANGGMSSKACIKRHLNQQAMQLLPNTNLKIKEVADQLHFSDEYQFSRFFRMLNGLAPIQYRKALAKATPRARTL